MLMRIREFEIDRERPEAIVDGARVALTRTEHRIVQMLAREPGRTYRRSEILRQALGADSPSAERTIDVHVACLRKKLGRFACCIETVRGVGYRLGTP